MTAPHALHDTNRADPSFRPPDLLWYKAALTEGSGDIEWKSELGFLGFSFSMAIER